MLCGLKMQSEVEWLTRRAQEVSSLLPGHSPDKHCPAGLRRAAGDPFEDE